MDYRRKEIARETRILKCPYSCVLLSTVASAKANPIPPIEANLWMVMTREDLTITISKAYGKVWAEVDGTYNFSLLSPFPSAVMGYPVPPDVEGISVKIDETPQNWTYVNGDYPTVLGGFPMITWTIRPVPDSFLIRTHYEYPLPTKDANSTFLYALGTGRYFTKPMLCDVYITLCVSKYLAPREDDIDVCLVAELGDVEPIDYVITSLDAMWNVTYVRLQTWQTKDFLLSVHRALGDINGDGSVDMSDLSAAIDAFLSYPGHQLWDPDTDLNTDGSIDMADIAILLGQFQH